MFTSLPSESSRLQEAPLIDSLQELVDTLASSLKRSVAVDDPSIRLIVYSSHFGDEDPVRLQSLLGRSITDPLLQYVMKQGIMSWHEPKYLEGNEEMGLSRRLCFPLWSRDQLLGFMWIIDHGSLSPAEVDLARETAERVRISLGRRAEFLREEDQERESLLLTLVAGDASIRGQAAKDLRDTGTFAQMGHFSAFSLSTEPGLDIGRSQRGSLLRHAMNKAMQTKLRESYVFSISDTGCVLVVGTRAPLTPAGSEGIAAQIHRELDSLRERAFEGTVIAAGDPVSDLSEVYASFNQAEAAARCARAQQHRTGVWALQGAMGLLSAAVTQEVSPHFVPELLKSMETEPAETLELIELFLESAGSAAKTGEILHMHRTTVYYRLAQFQKTYGVSLDDGETRFILQLWFKLRQLGLLASGPTPEQTSGFSGH